jgi:hypothetical protein
MRQVIPSFIVCLSVGDDPPYPIHLDSFNGVVTFERASLGGGPGVGMQSRRIALRHVCGIYFFPSSGSTGDINGGRETVTVFLFLR